MLNIRIICESFLKNLMSVPHSRLIEDRKCVCVCVNIFQIEIQFLYSEMHESFVFQLGRFYICKKEKKKKYIYIPN